MKSGYYLPLSSRDEIRILSSSLFKVWNQDIISLSLQGYNKFLCSDYSKLFSVEDPVSIIPNPTLLASYIKLASPISTCNISDLYYILIAKVIWEFIYCSVTSEWQTLEKGIITGCTMSAVLFSLTMNMLVKAAEVEYRGPLSRLGVRQSPISAYMDDLTVTTTSVIGGRWLLKGLERNMTWAKMYFKPAKSRSLVLKKGKVMEKVRFTVAGETIPTMSEKPIKSLGKTFNSSLKDTAAKQKTIKDLEEWLTKIDKLDCLVDLRHGYSSMQFCLGYCGYCSSMTFRLPPWNR